MCGIAGIIRFSGPPIKRGELKKMTDVIAHRGPDGEGQWVDADKKVGLGHRRLSILDLSEAGNQPMHYLGRYHIIFNGEIYNYIELKEGLERQGYQFKNATDTEVIMAAYDARGRDCIKDFDGMFAFVIYDEKDNILFCARDRFGEKPFYYHFGHDEFVFGSEMKALWAHGVERRPNDMAIYNYLISNKPIGEKRSDTFYQGIEQLKPAHSIKMQLSNPAVIQERYWSVALDQKSIGQKEAVERFRQLFEASITRRLRSDVPVGSSLSGGLDSSMVVGFMAQDKTIIQNTFSAAFPGFRKDESTYQKMMVDRVRTRHHSVSPDIENNLSNFDKILFHQEEPFGSMSVAIQYEVFKMARENAVPVLLDGQGADEILAGYSYFTFSYLREMFGRMQFYSALNSVKKASDRQAKSMLYFFGGSLAHIAPKSLVNRYKTSDSGRINNLLNPTFLRQFKNLDTRDLDSFSNLNRALDDKTNVYGLNLLLRYCDRNAMAHGVEVRLPFLNHELVEFIFSLPSNLKIHQGWTKWIARKAAEGFVPDQIIWRKEKVAYESPDNFLFKNKNLESVQKSLNTPEIEAFFDRNKEVETPKTFFKKYVLSKILSSE